MLSHTHGWDSVMHCQMLSHIHGWDIVTHCQMLSHIIHGWDSVTHCQILSHIIHGWHSIPQCQKWNVIPHSWVTWHSTIPNVIPHSWLTWCYTMSNVVPHPWFRFTEINGGETCWKTIPSYNDDMHVLKSNHLPHAAELCQDCRRKSVRILPCTHLAQTPEGSY